MASRKQNGYIGQQSMSSDLTEVALADFDMEKQQRSPTSFETEGTVNMQATTERDDIMLVSTSSADRRELVRKVRIVSWCSIVATITLGVVSLVAAILINSASILAFGLENFVDVVSSALVLWRFWGDSGASLTDDASIKTNDAKEARATVGIAFLFIVIAIIVFGQSVDHLAHHVGPDEGVPILVIAIISFFLSIIMAYYKWTLGKQLGSEAVLKDAICSAAGSVLSIGVIISAAIYTANDHIWWLDASVALLVALFLAGSGLVTLCTYRWWRGDFWQPYSSS